MANRKGKKNDINMAILSETLKELKEANVILETKTPLDRELIQQLEKKI